MAPALSRMKSVIFLGFLDEIVPLAGLEEQIRVCLVDMDHLEVVNLGVSTASMSRHNRGSI
jgi:hypothetical protein